MPSSDVVIASPAHARGRLTEPTDTKEVHVDDVDLCCSPDGIRTHATALRGRRPRPLDDGALGLSRCRGNGAERYQHRRPRASVAGVPGLEPRLTEPESVGLPITPYPTGAPRCADVELYPSPRSPPNRTLTPRPPPS